MKIRNTVAASLLIGLVLSLTILALFSEKIKELKSEIENRRGVLQEYHELLLRKTSLESSWEVKKKSIVLNADPQTALNDWLKEILSYAQTESLVMDKLEPAGIKEGPEGKRVAVFVSFQGDILKMIRLTYHLMESDPLAKVQSLIIRKEEGSKNLSFEFLLQKSIL